MRVFRTDLQHITWNNTSGSFFVLFDDFFSSFSSLVFFSLFKKSNSPRSKGRQPNRIVFNFLLLLKTQSHRLVGGEKPVLLAMPIFHTNKQFFSVRNVWIELHGNNGLWHLNIQFKYVFLLLLHWKCNVSIMVSNANKMK